MSSHVTICRTVLEFWSISATCLAKSKLQHTDFIKVYLMISSGQVGIFSIESTDTYRTLTDYYLLSAIFGIVVVDWRNASIK